MWWMPATHLISVDLPAPLSPDERHDLAGVHVEVHLVQGHDRAEVLGDSAQLQHRVVSLTALSPLQLRGGRPGAP